MGASYCIDAILEAQTSDPQFWLCGQRLVPPNSPTPSHALDRLLDGNPMGRGHLFQPLAGATARVSKPQTALHSISAGEAPLMKASVSSYFRMAKCSQLPIRSLRCCWKWLIYRAVLMARHDILVEMHGLHWQAVDRRYLFDQDFGGHPSWPTMMV